MAAILKASWLLYKKIFEECAASYSGVDLFLMNTPWPLVTIAVTYLYFITTLGPRLMKNRNAFNIERIMNVYNLVQIALCIDMISYIHSPIDYNGFPWFNFEIIYEDNIPGRYVYVGMYKFHVLKMIDLLDTVFFVLRKKNNQITFLHVYHHLMMYIITWVFTKFFPGGHVIIVAYINSYVHIFMYSYYFITSMWPQHKKKLWWKKYVTIVQMIQFAFITADTLPLFFMKETVYPKSLGGVIVSQNALMLVLFSNFYHKTYMKKEKINKM